MLRGRLCNLADFHLPSACAGAALSGLFLFGLFVCRSPPWLLRWFMTPDVKRFAWDALKQQREQKARPRRQRVVRLYLIRHGQSQSNQDASTVGGRDEKTPLTAKGESQARTLGERLKREGVSFHHVFASHAVRALHTAQLACEVLGFAGEIKVDQRVIEFSQGSLERQPRDTVYREGGAVKAGIRNHGNLFFRPPGYSPDGTRGESALDTEVRFSEFVDELLDAASLKQSTHLAGWSHAIILQLLVFALSYLSLSIYQAGSQQGEVAVGVFAHGMAIKSFLRGVLSASPGFLVTG